MTKHYEIAGVCVGWASDTFPSRMFVGGTAMSPRQAIVLAEAIRQTAEEGLRASTAGSVEQARKLRENNAKRLTEEAFSRKIGPVISRCVGQFVLDAEWRGPEWEVDANETLIEVLKKMQLVPRSGNGKIRQAIRKLEAIENGGRS